MTLDADSPIFITGAERSGLSMVASLVQAGGAFGGMCWGSNPTRMENMEILNSVLQPYIRLCGGDPDGQFPLVNGGQLLKIANLRECVLKRMMAQTKMRVWKKEDENVPWFLKSNLLALIWPTMKEAFPKAKWLLVRRSGEAVVASCLATGYMNKIKSERGWRWWHQFYNLRMDEIRESVGTDAVDVWPSRFVNGDFIELETTLVNWAGLKFDSEVAASFVRKEKQI